MSIPPDSFPPGSPSNSAPDGSGDAPPTWHWLFADEAGVVMPGPEVAFDSQDAAEDWLREEFEELAGMGIATVSLLDGEHAVFGPMYLTPDGDGPAAEAEF